MKRIGLHYMAAGPAGQDEDWWTLVHNDDGSHHVEHDWERKDAPVGDRARGPDKLSVEQSLDVAPLAVKSQLKQTLHLPI